MVVIGDGKVAYRSGRICRRAAGDLRPVVATIDKRHAGYPSVEAPNPDMKRSTRHNYRDRRHVGRSLHVTGHAMRRDVR